MYFSSTFLRLELHIAGKNEVLLRPGLHGFLRLSCGVMRQLDNDNLRNKGTRRPVDERIADYLEMKHNQEDPFLTETTTAVNPNGKSHSLTETMSGKDHMTETTLPVITETMSTVRAPTAHVSPTETITVAKSFRCIRVLSEALEIPNRHRGFPNQLEFQMLLYPEMCHKVHRPEITPNRITIAIND